MPLKNHVSKELFLRLYVQEDLTLTEIANRFGYSYSSAYKLLVEYGIPPRVGCTKKGREAIVASLKRRKGNIKRSAETRKKMSEANKGKFKKPSRFGGHIKNRVDGYVAVFVPNHPHANSEGYVMEHRLVMEQHLGREIKPGEVIHHKNGIRSDNRIENLQLMTSEEHARFHSLERYANGIMKNTVPVVNLTTGEVFESVKAAGEKYNVCPSLISKVCLGKVRSARGCKWKHLNTTKEGEIV